MTPRNRRPRLRLLTAAVALAWIVAACNMPTPTPFPSPTAVAFVTPTATPPATASPAALTPATPQPPPTTGAGTPAPPPATAVPAAPPCNMAAPGNPIDITIPDNTPLQPGETFTKVWRLVNTGTCTWTSNYALVWFSGPQLGAPVAVALPGDVPPGSTVDLAVDMVAPLAPGTYQSYWKLRSPAGVLFGIGPGAGAPFWVKIVVVSPTPAGPTATPTITPPPTATPTSTPTPTPTPATRHSGQAVLLPGDALEVDGETASSDDALYLTLDDNHILRPQDTATWGIYGSTPPSPDDCQNSPHSAADIPIDSLPTGTYLCYQSSDGYWGYARLTATNTTTWEITLDFLTWAIHE